MAYPDKPILDYSFTGFQQSQGDNSFPGTSLDGQLANLKDSADQTVDFITSVFNSDGTLKVAAAVETSALAAAQAAAEAAAATATAQAALVAGATALQVGQNLADLSNVVTARSNLGLGTAATTAATAYATAAQGAKADTALQALPAGSVVQSVNTTSGAVLTTTTVIPSDDTIPQITEGGELMTRSITPTHANNLLRIDVEFFGSTANANNVAVALFRDATANAIGAGMATQGLGNELVSISFTVFVTAGSTSSTTFRVRGGPTAAGTLTFNGAGGLRLFGGAMASSITVTEIKV